MLVEAVISVDACPLLAFSGLTSHLEDTGTGCDWCWCFSFIGFLRSDLSPWLYRNRCFLVVLSCLIVRRRDLGTSKQEAPTSEGKNTGVVLVPCHPWKCVNTAISDGTENLKVPGCHLLQQMSSQWGSLKLLQELVSWVHNLLFCFRPTFN